MSAVLGEHCIARLRSLPLLQTGPIQAPTNHLSDCLITSSVVLLPPLPLHVCVQCLPRPDTSAALDAGADDMQLDTADGSVTDALLPNPGPEMMSLLGDANALRFFSSRMRTLCSNAASMGYDVRKVLGVDVAGGAVAAIGTRQWLDSLDAIDLLTRRLNAYLADR